MPESLNLCNIVLHHALIASPSTGTSRKADFKTELKSTYTCDLGDNIVRCMLLNIGFPSMVVIGSHLFRRSNEHFAMELMNIENIDDVRNGLLLFRPLEKAYDNFDISFICIKDEFFMKVFNPDYRDKSLVDLLTRKEKQAISVCIIDSLGTFGDLEGRILDFGKTIIRPFKRCLNLQARLARNEALKKKWVNQEYDFEDFWSEGMSAAEKIEFYLNPVEEPA